MTMKTKAKLKMTTKPKTKVRTERELRDVPDDQWTAAERKASQIAMRKRSDSFFPKGTPQSVKDRLFFEMVGAVVRTNPDKCRVD